LRNLRAVAHNYIESGVGLPTVQRRLIRRHENDASALQWFLNRSGELQRVFEQAARSDHAGRARRRRGTTVIAGRGPRAVLRTGGPGVLGRRDVHGNDGPEPIPFGAG
jgi:hypothetical protein